MENKKKVIIGVIVVAVIAAIIAGAMGLGYVDPNSLLDSATNANS